MTNQHPITPPPELVQEWWLQAQSEGGPGFQLAVHYVATQAARWGADQELEACVQLTRDNDGYDAALGLRASRRPKPPSLKEQALTALQAVVRGAMDIREQHQNLDTIRRALEALPND
jgi:hypothetical protein